MSTQYRSVLRWFDGLDSYIKYSIVHIGPFEKDRDMYLPKLREKMRTKFPRARCTYWQTYVFDPPFEEEDYSLMQQAKDLLKELRREMLWGDSPHKDKPIVFICWGMSGGILLKQMILLLKEHIENNVNDWYDQADTSENLYENVSAVVLFGCAHDERPDNFSDRTLWSLIFEAGDDILNTQESMVTWKPVLDWFTSTTAEFRNLSLRFPVHTYYEMCQTRLSGLYGGPIQISEILCPEEHEALEASDFDANTIRMDHDSVSWLTNDDQLFMEFLRNMSGIIREYEDPNWLWEKTRITPAEDSTTRLADMQIPVRSRPSKSPGADSLHDRKRKVIDEDEEVTPRQPVPTERNATHQYSPSTPGQPQSKTPASTEFTIGWICALPIEGVAAIAMLDEEYEEYQDLPDDSDSTAVFTLGRIKNHKIVIACLPAGLYGTNEASLVAQEMSSNFPSIRVGFLIGIGGGVPSKRHDIRLGDVVVSQPNGGHGGVIQYDFGKAEVDGFHRTGYLARPPRLLLRVLSKVQMNHRHLDQNRQTYPYHMKRFWDRDDMPEYRIPQDQQDILYRQRCIPHIKWNRECANCNQIVNRPDRPKDCRSVQIHYGNIASGNQVIKDGKRRDKIVKDLDTQILCFEMEAAGLLNHWPCLVVRGISDYCDAHKNDAWQEYAAGNAAAFTRELLLSLPQRKVVQLKHGQ